MKNDLDLFSLGLGLAAPWRVTSSGFNPKEGGLVLTLDCQAGVPMPCPHCQRACPRYDTVNREWRHLNFWQHETHLSASVPRVSCPEHGVVTVEVPWARSGSGFTLLFEALVVRLAKDMPMAAIARLVGEHDGRLWRLLQHYVDTMRAEVSQAEVCSIGVDETSANAKTPFITVVVDMEEKKVLFATPGKDSSTIEAFAEDLVKHGGDPKAITEVSADMSKAFIAGVEQHLPNAEMTFDKFHAVQLVTDALDEVRRQECAEGGGTTGLLTGSRYALLKNVENQTDHQAILAKVIALPELHLKTGRAYRLKLAFQEAYQLPGEAGVEAMRCWCQWAQRSRLPDFARVARTIRKHWDGITRYFTSGITNAILEGINSLIQAAKARARGFRNVDYLISMVYLIAGKLPMPDLK
jgi:transposase